VTVNQQFQGLAPTLIIVRVAYGKSVNSVSGVIASSMNFAARTRQDSNAGNASRLGDEDFDCVMSRRNGGLDGDEGHRGDEKEV
ncbi:hypothetical protein V5O48_014701, partial [Marasmius crinis-equi]